MNVDSVRAEAEQLPTVESGLITLLTRIRYEIEANGNNPSAMATLARQIDTNSAEWADAIIAGTPAEIPTAERAKGLES